MFEQPVSSGFVYVLNNNDLLLAKMFDICYFSIYALLLFFLLLWMKKKEKKKKERGRCKKKREEEKSLGVGVEGDLGLTIYGCMTKPDTESYETDLKCE